MLVDDQELLRRGLRLLLEAAGGIDVVAEAADGHEALAMLIKHDPEVVLADARMPGMDGVELVRRCRAEHPGTPVVILTTYDDDDLVRDAVRAGAAGFLLKDVSPERLAEAITSVRDGGVVIDPRGGGFGAPSAVGTDPRRPVVSSHSDRTDPRRPSRRGPRPRTWRSSNHLHSFLRMIASTVVPATPCGKEAEAITDRAG
ncbi:MAG: response regulator transcription factor [Microlunatus sp.]|nr:response regulator transcription factor [Microlunatus sp.]